MRQAFLQFLENGVTYGLRIATQMRVPKSQRLDPLRLQKPFPRRIMRLLLRKTVLTAVEFNIEFGLFTKEIQVIIADEMLATEFIAAKPTVTQPENIEHPTLDGLSLPTFLPEKSMFLLEYKALENKRFWRCLCRS